MRSAVRMKLITIIISSIYYHYYQCIFVLLIQLHPWSCFMCLALLWIRAIHYVLWMNSPIVFHSVSAFRSCLYCILIWCSRLCFFVLVGYNKPFCCFVLKTVLLRFTVWDYLYEPHRVSVVSSPVTPSWSSSISIIVINIIIIIIVHNASIVHNKPVTR